MKPCSLSRRFTRWFLLLLIPPSAFRLPPSAFSAPADPLIPGVLATDRYKTLAARSPFSPPTADAPAPVVAATPPPPGWGEKYTLGGLAQFGSGYKVTLNPKNPVGAGASASAGGNNVNASERIIVVSGTEGPDGITLAGVQWSDDPKQTRATLLKNGVPALFNFDPSALTTAKGSAASSVPAPRNSIPSPGAVPMMPNGAFTPPPFPPNGATPPQPGIIHSPGTRAPIRPPPPPPGSNGQTFIPPPPPPTIAPVRAARLPAPAVAVPGNAATDDDDD